MKVTVSLLLLLALGLALFVGLPASVDIGAMPASMNVSGTFVIISTDGATEPSLELAYANTDNPTILLWQPGQISIEDTSGNATPVGQLGQGTRLLLSGTLTSLETSRPLFRLSDVIVVIRLQENEWLESKDMQVVDTDEAAVLLTDADNALYSLPAAEAPAPGLKPGQHINVIWSGGTDGQYPAGFAEPPLRLTVSDITRLEQTVAVAIVNALYADEPALFEGIEILALDLTGFRAFTEIDSLALPYLLSRQPYGMDVHVLLMTADELRANGVLNDPAPLNGLLLKIEAVSAADTYKLTVSDGQTDKAVYTATLTWTENGWDVSLLPG